MRCKSNQKKHQRKYIFYIFVLMFFSACTSKVINKEKRVFTAKTKKDALPIKKQVPDKTTEILRKKSIKAYYESFKEVYQHKLYYAYPEGFWIFFGEQMQAFTSQKNHIIPYKDFTETIYVKCNIEENESGGIGFGRIGGCKPGKNIMHPDFSSMDLLGRPFLPNVIETQNTLAIVSGRGIRGVYYFTKSGKFLGKNTTDYDLWERLRKGSNNAKYSWSYNHKYLIYHGKFIENKNGFQRERKRIMASYYSFAGQWVLVVQSVPYCDVCTKAEREKIAKYKIVLVDRATAEKKAEFYGWVKDANIESPLFGYRYHKNGFYIDRSYGPVLNPPDATMRPYRWFGKTIIDLESDPKSFCYVYKEKKKCVPDPGMKLREVVEGNFYRLYITKEKIYVERFGKTKKIKALIK